MLTTDEKNDLTNLLAQLVQIPSVNTGINQKGVPEEEISQFIDVYLQKIGMSSEFIRMPDGRPHVYSRWRDEDASKPVLVLSAHTDTVNVDEMTIDPFSAKIENGKMLGRGTTDTKGSLATFLWTLSKIEEGRKRCSHTIRFLATCNEENGCVGSRWLADQGFTADEIIVGEPTNNQIVTAHRGGLILEFETKGRSVHASVPHKGDNAVYQMSDLIHYLRHQWIPKFSKTLHPLIGQATAAITMMSGGVRYNIIPDSCHATMDLRFLPNQDANQIIDDLQKAMSGLKKMYGIQATVKCRENLPALNTDASCLFVNDLLSARRRITGFAEPTGVPYIADSSQFVRNGATCVVFGPGDISQAHSADEFLELNQLYESAEILLAYFDILES